MVRYRVHGTFCCPEHQRKASAGDCVRTSRDNQRRELIEKAAAILVRWRIVSPQWQEDGNRKQELAFALSATQLCQRYKLDLRSNWVTRHCHPIEKKRFELRCYTIHSTEVYLRSLMDLTDVIRQLKLEKERIVLVIAQLEELQTAQVSAGGGSVKKGPGRKSMADQERQAGVRSPADNRGNRS